MIRWLVILLMLLVVGANVMRLSIKQSEHIDQLIDQYDCYLVGTKNPGAYNSQPVYRCGNIVVARDRIEEKLPLTPIEKPVILESN